MSGGNNIEIQARDIALLRSLFESRVMTSAHVAALYFDGRREAAKKRLQALGAAGLVGSRERTRSNEQARLFLSKAGIALLSERGILAEYPVIGAAALAKRGRVGDATVRHELDVMDAKTAFLVAARASRGLSVAEFCTWPRMCQFRALSAVGADFFVRPDGFIRICDSNTGSRDVAHCFYLEVDRSTESLDALANRACGYLDHYRSGGFAVREGRPRTAFREHPFRVLMVFKTAERRNNMAERLLRGSPPILTLVHLSTLDEVRADPLGAVWIRPVDYRDATRGTPFDTDRRVNERGYRRQAPREVFVEAAARRLRLFPDER